MDVSEKWGNDVETAVGLALDELKLTRDEVEVTVLEEPSKGFFGIGAKLALVRVERKKKVEEVKEPVAEIKKPEPVKQAKKPRQDKSAKSNKHVEKVKEEKESIILTTEDVEGLVDAPDHPAVEFLKEVAEQMGLNINVSAVANDTNVFVNIDGKDSGTIIGKRGQTLDAIQYLTSLVVNKGKNDYIRVVIDAENYRSKREKTLEKLANRLADKVVKTKRSVRLEPMNPYERKVIHATLQSNPRVTTRSEGQDPYRRVIIELK
ncbi:MAG: protein jag [Eubacteriaceae bacterium]|nr:protein jag [Eubacteriaceae bacterium]